MGGQLRRNKAYWFASVDGLASDDTAVATVRHPTTFFAQPTVDQLEMLAARLELPGPDLMEQGAATYSAALNAMAGLLGPVARSTNQWQGFGRLDWQATERQHMSLEGNETKLDAPGGGLTRSSETYGSHSFGNHQASESWGQVKLDSFLTANLLNSVGVQYRRHLQSSTPQTPSAFEAPLLANGWGQLPEMIADSTDGFILGKPARLGSSHYPDERNFLAQETLSWAHGANVVKFGGSLGHIYDAVGVLNNQTGTYSYATVFNFVSDTESFTNFGLSTPGNPSAVQHYCDATGKVYRVSDGTLGGRGNLPCYAWYSQEIGPTNWNLSTNDIAGFVTEQWQAAHNLTISVGLRVEAEQLPAPIALVDNSDLPATEKLPATTLNWGPRVSMAWAPGKGTVIRIGTGLYYGRIDNSAVLAALTQTGSANGDMNLFFKPTNAEAPPFPYVFSAKPGAGVVPGAVSFAPGFRPQEVEQAVVSLEQDLPDRWKVLVSGLASLGRRLPISIDTNLDTSATATQQTITYTVVDAIGAGPIKTPTVKAPLYTARLNANYQQLASIESRANSTYDAGMIRLSRVGSHGLTLDLHYLYAHATDWNPNESSRVAVDDVLDPADFRLEYGTSNLDVRHSASGTVTYGTPWKRRDWTGYLANFWSVAAVAHYRSGLPYTMRTSGYLPGFYDDARDLIEGVGPGINGSGGDNRLYGIGRNTYRYPATYAGDARLSKRFNFANHREFELLGESFNLFNHQNVTRIETTGYSIDRGTLSGGPPTLTFLTGLTKAGLPSTTPEFGKPLDVNATNYYRPREFQVGMRARF
jgi:hypothetical protein